MKHIELNIGKACNNKCRFCMSANVWLDEKELSDFNLVKSEIIKYADQWYRSIWFLWWDISIHPKIYEIIWEAKRHWFLIINVITNAMLYSDYDKALKLVNSWVTRVNISIHSHIENIEDYLTQIPWWLNKKLKAIDNFNTLYEKWILKNNISINFVLNKENLSTVDKSVLYFYSKKWIKDIRINFLWNKFFISDYDRNRLQINYTEIIDKLKKLIFISLKYSIRITFDSIPACILSKIWFVNSKGIVSKFLWEQFDHINTVYNINKLEKFDWINYKKNDLKTKFSKCNKCIYLNSCEWVWKEYVIQYWNDEFYPINYDPWRK